jgi:tetratricopeptide (TPR) repeat protein
MTEDATMKAGVDALYGKKDPNTAAVQFRKVLDRNPSPYGATFQLAMALDRAGKPAEALPLWEKVLTMAEGYNDKDTADSARAGLETSREAVAMKTGLDALYTRRNAEDAAAQFRKVLEWNPNHYGATFQLAMALDQGGKRGEARPWWKKALKMAEASHDKDTAAADRARLAEQP